MWKRILFLTLGLSIGGGAGFLGSQYLSSNDSKASRQYSRSYSDKNYSASRSESKRSNVSKSKKRGQKTASKKKSRSGYQKTNKKKSKFQKRPRNHRAEVNLQGDASVLASTEVTALPENASTPWINDLSGESARLNMESTLKSERGCAEARCFNDRDRSITLVGVVVETNDLKPRNGETLVDGDLQTGDGQSRPAVYVR
jgi:hypothetical protein